jgi:hypothetical protein
MSAGIGDGSSAASYDRFNAGANTNISITSDTNTSIGDKSLVVGSKENQKLEHPKIERNADLGISTDGVNNLADAPLSVNDRALNVIVGKHSDTAL